MPCLVCEYYFVNKPCGDKALKIVKASVHCPRAKYGQHSINSLTRKFNLMRHKCPCIDCLVKMICLDVCEDFNFQISKEGKYNQCHVHVRDVIYT